MAKRPDDDRHEGSGDDVLVAQPASAPSLLLVGSLLKADGEQELVRVKATVDAPLDATCIRRVRRLLEALSRTMLSRDRSRWDRIDQARLVLVADDADNESPTERTSSSDAQTQKRMRVPSDGAPAAAGLRAARADGAPTDESADRSEAPTRRVRIESGSTRRDAGDSRPEEGPMASEPGSAPSAEAPLAPPAPRPSPWATTSLAALSGPPKPPLPFPARDRSVPMVLGSEAARLAGGPQHPSLLGAPPTGGTPPSRASSALAPPSPGAAQRNDPPGSSNVPRPNLPAAGQGAFDDARSQTVAFDGPARLGAPLPFQPPRAHPEPSQEPGGVQAPPAPTPVEEDGRDDSDLPTMTVDRMSQSTSERGAPRSTSRERQSEPIEATLARLARAAGESISSRTDSTAASTSEAAPSAGSGPAFPAPAADAAQAENAPELSGGLAPGSPAVATVRGASTAAGSGSDAGATIAATGLFPDGSDESLDAALAAMSVEQYAALCAETALRPEHRAAIHRAYRIDDEQRRSALDRRWRARLDADETLARQWRWHYAQHEQRLKGRP